MTIAAAMALDHIGIGRRILLLAFSILFGGPVFAFAIAIALACGLGAKDAVARALDRQARPPEQPEDKLDHV